MENETETKWLYAGLGFFLGMFSVFVGFIALGMYLGV